MTKKLPDIDMLNPNAGQSINLGQTAVLPLKISSIDNPKKSKIKRSFHPPTFEAPNIDALKGTCDKMV